MAYVSNNYIDRKRYVAVEGEGSGFGIISGSDWDDGPPLFPPLFP